jgi:hypothetical protein
MWQGTNRRADIIGQYSTVPVVGSIDVDLVRVVAPYVRCRVTLVEGVDNRRIVSGDRHCEWLEENVVKGSRRRSRLPQCSPRGLYTQQFERHSYMHCRKIRLGRYLRGEHWQLSPVLPKVSRTDGSGK